MAPASRRRSAGPGHRAALRHPRTRGPPAGRARRDDRQRGVVPQSHLARAVARSLGLPRHGSGGRAPSAGHHAEREDRRFRRLRRRWRHLDCVAASLLRRHRRRRPALYPRSSDRGLWAERTGVAAIAGGGCRGGDRLGLRHHRLRTAGGGRSAGGHRAHHHARSAAAAGSSHRQSEPPRRDGGAMASWRQWA